MVSRRDPNEVRAGDSGFYPPNRFARPAAGQSDPRIWGRKWIAIAVRGLRHRLKTNSALSFCNCDRTSHGEMRVNPRLLSRHYWVSCDTLEADEELGKNPPIFDCIADTVPRADLSRREGPIRARAYRIAEPPAVNPAPLALDDTNLKESSSYEAAGSESPRSARRLPRTRFSAAARRLGSLPIGALGHVVRRERSRTRSCISASTRNDFLARPRATISWELPRVLFGTREASPGVRGLLPREADPSRRWGTGTAER